MWEGGCQQNGGMNTVIEASRVSHCSQELLYIKKMKIMLYKHACSSSVCLPSLTAAWVQPRPVFPVAPNITTFISAGCFANGTTQGEARTEAFYSISVSTRLTVSCTAEFINLFVCNNQW